MRIEILGTARTTCRDSGFPFSDPAKLNTVREVLKSNDRWFRKNLGVEQLVTFAQPGLTGDREVTLKVSCPNENQPQNPAVDPLRSYSLWKAGCAERFDSLKGLALFV